MKVSVSILSSFGDKKCSTKELMKVYDKTDVDYIHIDVMDGKFVDRKTFSFSDIKKSSIVTNKKLDVHLMVNNPKKYIDDYALLNTEYITFHYEAVKDTLNMINYIKNYGLKVGISINPNTPVEVLYPYLKYIDMVLVMSVECGASYQSFIYDTVSKIKKLKTEIEEQKYKILINVDGGINEETSKLVCESGADMVVSDSFIRKDIKNNIKYLKTLSI